MNQRGIFNILEVLLELQMQLGAPVRDKVKESLVQVNGKGKAAKMAKQLTELEGYDGGIEKIVHLQIVAKRLEMLG